MIKMEVEPEVAAHGGFVKVMCPDCSNEQVLFWRTNTVVNCQVCGGTLAEPTGGKAILKGELVGVVE
jgi:small subunit ribosomal protein S27e